MDEETGVTSAGHLTGCRFLVRFALKIPVMKEGKGSGVSNEKVKIFGRQTALSLVYTSTPDVLHP